MTLDRLSSLDESFLRIETDAAHMHLGWTLLIDGEPPRIDLLRTHVAGRLDQLPRFRRRVLESSLRLHDPVWVDDAEFDIARHVKRVVVAPPGGRGALRRLAGELLSRRLDRRRPLWRLYLVEGLRDGGFAIVGQAHHALVDGIAAVEVAQLLLDGRPDTSPARPRGFSPETAPGLRDRIMATVAQRARLGREAASAAARALADPAVAEDVTATLRRISATVAAVGRPAPATAFNHRIGRERAVGFTELSFHAAKEVGRQQGATINDVVLATIAVATGRYLRRIGESPPWLRVLVPVSTRSNGAANDLGNEISVMFVELPVGERDPVAALAEVARQTNEQKRGDHAGALDGLLRAGSLMPAPLRDAFAWLATRPQTFNAVVSNVPGPSQPLYLLGRRVRAAYPAVPLVQGHGLAIGALSYCGVLHIGLYADPAVVPDVADLGRDVACAFDALRRAVGPTPPVPPRPGARVLGDRALRERVLV
jgi:WS/DGAT/MGAT family acyltransferase